MGKLYDDMQLSELPIDKMVEDCYIEYGDYVNNFRAIPNILDGLKPSYRRLIQTAFEEPDRMTKTASILGTCMSKFHPHNTESLNETTIPLLVKSRIFDGQGNFGHKPLTRDDACGPAAPRYTEVKLNSTFRSQLSKIASSIPTTTSFSGHQEFDYIPTPIPFSLTFGNLGIGVGIGTTIPPFTMKSLLDAYRKDNPDLLKLNYGYLTDDKDGLRDLWETGNGGIEVAFPIEEGWSGGNYGWWISGYPNIFYPNLDLISEWIGQGRVFIRDETSVTPKLFISRIKRMRTPTDEELKDAVYDMSRKYMGFKVVTTWKGVARPIGIRDWVGITYNNYINLLNKYKETSIENMNHEIIMWSNFKAVAERLLNREPQDKICKDLGIDSDIVSAIGAKSINTLVNADPKLKIKGLEKSIESYKTLNPVSMVDDFVSEVG